jgi:hypothetical protein
LFLGLVDVVGASHIQSEMPIPMLNVLLFKPLSIPPSNNPLETGFADQKDFACIEIMTGYDKLSTLIGRYPSLAIYRRFGALSAKVLLHMQAELVHLENELSIISQRNSTDPEKARFDVSWEALDQASSEGAADFQRNLVLQIQEKLAVYRMWV